MELIDLVFDHEYFIKLAGETSNSGWSGALELYKSKYIPKCLQPNIEFIKYEELLYAISSQGKKTCELDAWLGPLRKETTNELLTSYLYLIGDENEIKFKNQLFRNNLKELTHYFPNDLEKLLILDTQIQNQVLEAISNNPDNKLSLETINYLEKKINVSNDKTFLKFASIILTHYSTYYADNLLHTDFLIKLALKDSNNNIIKENVIKKFSEDVHASKKWHNTKVFDSFISLLKVDNSNKDLAKTFIFAHEKHGYTANLESIYYFEKMLDDETLREDVTNFLNQSLAKLLTSISSDINKIESHISTLFNKVGSLSENLVDSIFTSFSKDPRHLGSLIVDLFSESKQEFSSDLLSKLINPIAKILDSKVSLFLATRLINENITLPTAVLKNFIKYLSVEESQSLAINLFDKLDGNIPNLIANDLVDALIEFLPKVSKIQYLKIRNIFKNFKFTVSEQIRIDIQEQVSNWNFSNNLEEKLEITQNLYKQINKETIKELADFFKEVYSTQNYKLINLSLLAIIEIKKYQNIIWGDILSTNSIEIELANGNKFLLSKTQSENISKQLILYDIKVEQIICTNIKDLTKFLEFIEINKIDKDEIAQALESTFDINVIYNKLLINLVKKVGSSISKSNSNLMKQSVDYLVNKLFWPTDSLYSFIKKVKQNDILSTISLLEKLSDYNVGPEDLNRKGVSAHKIVSNLPFDELAPAINQVITDNQPYIVKSVDALLEEIKISNQDNLELLNLIEKGYFTSQLEKVELIKKNGLNLPKSYNITRSLSDWKAEDFIKWRQTLTQINDDNIAEVIAVLSEAAHDTILDNNSYPRSVQMIALLALIKSPNGGLAQIATGEGKTLINSMFAIIRAISGVQVDIITSSEVLAKRDSYKLKPFYNMFGITVDHNIINSLGPKLCYKANVLYGDLIHFIGDTLRDTSENTKMGRGFNLVIVDEVDNMFIDQNNMKVQLSSMIPGFDTLSQILVYIWSAAMASASALEQKEGMCYYNQPILNEDLNSFDPKIIEDEEAKFESIPFALNCATFIQEYIKEHISNYTRTNLFAFENNRESRNFVVPNHLEKFSKDQLENWITSIVSSFYYKDKLNYIVSNPSTAKQAGKEFSSIAPIDFQNTGVIQYNLQWSDGLHQFLQLRHLLTLTPENIVSTFMSFVGYFDKYKGNIYGVTGTLGSKDHHDYLKNVYDVKLTIIPNFVKKRFVEFVPVITDNIDNWQKQIIEVINRKILNQRSGLIILETIEEVEHIQNLLIQSGYNSTNIITYGLGQKNEKNIEEQELKIGDIIIATNLAGRGTDLKISHELAKNLGLHVIMTVFSSSSRVQNQGFGRGARQGDFGSAQLIINIEHINSNCMSDIICLNDHRKTQELQSLNEDRFCNNPNIMMRDKLFNSYIEVAKEANSPTGYNLLVSNPSNQELSKGTVYLYHNYSKIFINIVSDDIEKSNILDITSLIKDIDPNAAQHLKTILSNVSNSASSLSIQDYELIHFILAKNGYTQHAEIMLRIQNNFNEEIKLLPQEVLKKEAGIFTSNKKIYLKWLLIEEAEFQDILNADKIITDDLLKKIEDRKLYLLWLADRKIYNNQYEIKQITEDWGMWLKSQESLFDRLQNCQIDNKEEQSILVKLQQKISLELNNNFNNFKNETNERIKKGELIQNPNHYVSKAWQYWRIYFLKQQQASNYGHITGSNDWFSYVSNMVQTVWQDLSSRISLGAENYKVDTPLASAVGFLDKAIKIDDFYSWTAHNAMSYIRLLKDGAHINQEEQASYANQVKQQFMEDTERAVQMIENIVIPGFSSQLTALQLYNILDYKSDFAIQLIGSIKIYQKITDAMIRNIEIAGKSAGNEMIRASRSVDLEELTKDINITQAIFEAANQTLQLSKSGRLTLDNLTSPLNFTSKQMILDQISISNGMIFEIQTYELQADDDWMGTILSAAIGGLLIWSGLWMIKLAGTTGTVLSTFGTSVVMQGIGDIIGSLIAVSTGKPINFGDYINAKGMAIGISLATAGIMHFGIQSGFFKGEAFLDKLGEIKNAVNIDQTAFLFKAAAIQTATTVAGAALYSIGKKLVDTDDIKAEADKAIQEITIAYKELLNQIFANDEFSGNKKLQNSLIEQIKQIVRTYQKRFNDDGSRFGIGVGSEVAGNLLGGFGSVGNMIGISNAFQTGTKVIIGGIKNAEALGSITEDTRRAIESIGIKAFKTGILLEQKLEKEFGKDTGGKLALALNQQGHLVKGELHTKECKKLNEIKLSTELDRYKQGIVSICDYVKGLINKEYQSNYGEFKSNFVGIVTGAISSIQKQEIVKPITDSIASETGESIYKYINKKVEESKKPSNDNHKQKSSKLDPEKIIEQINFDKKSEEAKKVKRIEQAQSNEALAEQYIVKKGDNLDKIAAKYGKSLVEVIKANPHIKNPNLIQPGQKINIPANNYGSNANMCKFSDDQFSNYEDFVSSIKNKEPQNYCSIGEDKKTIDIGLEYNKLSKEDKFEIQKNLALTRELENAISKNPTKQEKGILEGKLKSIAEKASHYLKRYEQYENSHPIKAKAALISGLVLAKGLTGAAIAGVSTGGAGIIPRFIAGVGKGSVDEIKGAAIGFAIGDDIGAFINKGIEEYSPAIIKLDSTLSPQDAAMLSSLALAAMLSSSEFISFAKSMKSVDFAGVKINNGKVEGFSYFKADDMGSKGAHKTGKIDLDDVGHKTKLDDFYDINKLDDIHLKSIDKLDLNKVHKVNLAHLSDEAIAKVLSKLPDHIENGRIDYKKDFVFDLNNFEKDSMKLFNGKLKEDTYFINYHDSGKEIGFGQGKRTMTWATHIEVGNKMPTIEDIHQHLALVRPEWGKRDAVSVIKIPSGTDVSFISGKAIEQRSDITGKAFKGTGYQVRFRDFDPKWVVDTKKLPGD